MRALNELEQLPLPRLAERRLGSGSSCLGLIGDDALSEEAGVDFAFSMRMGGVSRPPYATLNIATHVGDDPADVAENRHRLFKAMGLPDAVPVNPLQVHGTDVAVYPREDDAFRVRASLEAAGIGGILFPGPPDAAPAAGGGAPQECDAVVSARPGMPVVLCCADCALVVIVAPTGDFAVAHSGWKGSLGSIAGKSAQVLAVVSGCRPASFNAYIGPHVGPCCYEVGEDLLERFVRRFGAGCRAGEGSRLDLGFAVEQSLGEAGLLPERIASTGICTADSTDRFYSHRAENGDTGRFAALCRKRPL